MNNRIKLIKGKQRELILIAKTQSKLTWKNFSILINISYGYLTNELINEKRTLSEKSYFKLCKLANVDYNKYIISVLTSNWGQIKGSKNVKNRKNLFKKLKPKLLCKKSFNLAEIIGIMIGDGSIYVSPKYGIYKIDICGNFKDEKEYMINYLKPLFEKTFKIKFNFRVSNNAMHLYKNSKSLVFTFKKYGIPSGNKSNNNIKIPNWIMSNKQYLKACFRGIVDTDGCVYPRNKTNKYPNIWISSGIPSIRKSISIASKNLNIHISDWRPNRRDISITRRLDVEKYFEEIGFKNPKNLRRFEKFIVYR